MFTPENLATIEQVTEELEADSGQVLGVISPVTALEFSASLVTSSDGNPFNAVAAKALAHAAEVAEAEGDTTSAEAREADLVITSERLLAIPAAEQTLDNPEWVKFLLYDNDGEVRKALRPFFPDDTHAQMITRLPGNLSIEDEGIASDSIVEITDGLQFEGVETTTTGAPILLKDINDYLRGGMLTLGAIAVAVMIVILMLFFNVRWRLLPLAVVLIGIVWAFGIAGYLGIPLTLVTIAGLPVMLGIGIDYAIQMHSRIEEEVIIDRSPHPIQAAARGLGPALLVVTFDAVFAFAAIQISKVPMIRDFGWLLTVGIVAICVSSIINPLAALGIREYRSPTKGRDFSEGALGRLVVKLGSLPASSAVLLAVAAVVVFAVGSVLEPKLKLQTDPINWVDQDSQVIKDLRHIEEEVGGSSELGVFVTSDTGDSLFTDEVVTFVDEFTHEQIEQVRQGAAGRLEHRRDGRGPDRHPRCGARVADRRRRAGGVGRRAGEHPAVDRGTRRRCVQRRVPDQADVARGTGGGRRRRARDRGPARDEHHPVGPRGGRRRAAGEPRGQPGRADLAGGRTRVPVPPGPSAVASCGRCCRWCRCSSRRASPRSRSTSSASS